MGNRGTHPQAAGCHDTLQSRASILHDICQASITRDMACRGEGRETIRLERILFENVSVTDGTLALPRELKVSREANRFTISWQEERTWKTTASTDKLQVGVIYDNDPRIPRLACQVKGVRGESQGEFSLNEEIGQNAHLYIFFSSDDGLRFSPSQHVHVE